MVVAGRELRRRLPYLHGVTHWDTIGNVKKKYMERRQSRSYRRPQSKPQHHGKSSLALIITSYHSGELLLEPAQLSASTIPEKNTCH